MSTIEIPVGAPGVVRIDTDQIAAALAGALPAAVAAAATFVADDAPTPGPPPGPPPPLLKPAPNNFRLLFQPLGNPDDASFLWTDHCVDRAPATFDGVQLAFYNHGTGARVIQNHMIAVGPAGVLSPGSWIAGQPGLTIPGGAAPSSKHAPGRVITGVFDARSVEAADGLGPFLMRRASMYGSAWHISPGQNGGSVWDAAAWDASYPDAPLWSWVRWLADHATPATAGTDAGWTSKPGRASVATPIFLHSAEHWGLIHVGDSTGGADLIDPPHVNHLGALWRAVRDMAVTGARISYANLCQGGSSWADMKRQLQSALDAGWVFNKRMVALQSFTSNENLTPAGHLTKMGEMVAMVKAAGGTPILLGPMCSQSHDQTRIEIRAALQAGTEEWLDIGGVIGQSGDPSVFADGMCGDPVGSHPRATGTHQSLMANAALKGPARALIERVIA